MNAEWIVDPKLIAVAIKGLITAILWLCGVIGTLGTTGLGLLLYIDRQRMKKIDHMSDNIETIANTLTENGLLYEHRLTSLETDNRAIRGEIENIRELCGDRRHRGVCP